MTIAALTKDSQPTGGPTPRGALKEVALPFVNLVSGLRSYLSLTIRTLLWIIRPPYRLGEQMKSMDFIG